MRKPILFVALVAVVFLWGSISARATDVNITIIDLADAVTVTGPSGALTFACPAAEDLEVCRITLKAPSNKAHITATSGAGGVGAYPTFAHFAEPGTTSSTLCDQDPSEPSFGPCISDGLRTTPSKGTSLIGAKSVKFTFQSDPSAPEDSGLPSCSTAASVGGCQFIENGTPQEVGTITWSDGTVTTVDHIRVESDVPPEVPEPSSLMLFGSGLLIVGGFLQRRRRLV